MVELEGASRWYGDVIGVNDVTCTIGTGITALIGQNGAGKSTLIRLITGQLMPTTGVVRVAGHEPFANPEVYKILGYCPEIDNFYEFMTGRRFVVHMARLQGMSPALAKSKAEEMLALVGMIDRCDKAIAGYSKGMRQRIKLAQAMVHEPQLILLDEPLNGLDPVGRHQMMELLGSLAERGKAIIVSSHILYELEQLTRSIVLLHHGRLLANGNLRAIRSVLNKHPQRIQMDTPEPKKTAGALLQMEDVISVSVTDDRIEVQTKNAESFYHQLGETVLKNGLVIHGFSSIDQSMEAVFDYLVER